MEMLSRAALMRKRWCGRSWILALAAALSVTGAYGDVIWIGRPTVGDYMAHSVQQALGEFRQVQGQIAQFEAQIADARQAYFAAPASSRDAAGDRFGQLLLQKDLLIAWPRVIGDDASSRMVANLMALANNGRQPDGGIPPSARQAFNQWVAAMRFYAGRLWIIPRPGQRGACSAKRGQHDRVRGLSPPSRPGRMGRGRGPARRRSTQTDRPWKQFLGEKLFR